MERDWNTLMQDSFNAQKFLCVGIDPILEKIPPKLQRDNAYDTLTHFGCQTIDAVQESVGFLKPNWAFFLAHGQEGFAALKHVINHAHRNYPSLPVIVDCKVGDIGTTNDAYAKCLFEELKADAITAHSYLGKEAMMSFLNRADKGTIFLCHTSNKGAGEFQELELASDGKPLYLKVAENINKGWDFNGNCGLVAGATYAKDIEPIRTQFPSGPILIPGIGTQGGDLDASVKAGRNAGGGIIINSSSGIIFAENPGQAAQDLNKQIKAAFLA